MAKEDINLLPPLVVRARYHSLVIKQRDRVVYTVLLGLLFIATAYAANWYTLYQSEVSVRGELTNLKTDVSAVQRQAVQINAFIRALAARIILPETWTERAVQVLDSAPQSIAITRLNVVAAIVDRQPADAIIIEGNSPTREALITFEESIQALPWVVHIEAPLRNLSGSAPPFQFSFVAFRTKE